MNIKDKARKRALFLHCAGQKTQDIFDTSTNRRLFEERKHKKNTTRLDKIKEKVTWKSDLQNLQVCEKCSNIF